MDEIVHRLDCFDDVGKQEAIQYLNKSLTKFFQLKVKTHRKCLEKQGVDKDHINDLNILRMYGFGLISKEEAQKSIRNVNVRVN